MAGGYTGKILMVDLSKGEFRTEEPGDEVYQKFLAGYGLGAKVIFDKQMGGVDPLGEDAILGFTAGILTGTGALFSGRYMVVGKSPLTGGWGDANSGGSFGPEIKKTGFDGIFFRGKSEKPVYLLIDGDKIELRDAGKVWGKDVIETEEIIWEELGDKGYKVAAIGPSGEKLSLISGIVNDKGRVAARSGLGAVMGSKKLKALVLRGNKKVTVHDREKIVELSKKFSKRIEPVKIKFGMGGILGVFGKLLRFLPHTRMEPALWGLALKKYGTCGVLSLLSESGDTPTKNFKGVGYLDFPVNEHSSKISDDRVIKYEQKKFHCMNCPIGCGGIISVKEGPYPLEESHKPEYETLASFGTLCLNDDLYGILKLNDICNRAGLDTISTGVTVAFALECYEQGIITKADTDGIELNWGDSSAILKLTEKIINREGIGDILADGVKVAAQKLGKGSEKFAMHAGGQEIPMHDPRFDIGYAAAYEVEPTPGRHTIASLLWQELMQVERKFKEAKRPAAISGRKDRYRFDNKGKGHALNTIYVQVANGAGLCIFGLEVGGNVPIFEWLNAATGWSFSSEDYLQIGERIETIRHSFNVREGIKPRDFKMADRATGHPPLEKGPVGGVTLDMETLGKNFYKEFDWNYENGLPTRERLEKLGLKEVIEALYS
ncbi:MAG: aldehyde ferredoxin oxidoreductase family protein [Deltaproteobacteria bacterium]|nr:MAG: aldehyde ferredoxin oxidoreductase family protein [Deltaproteobacteria bacterium]